MLLIPPIFLLCGVEFTLKKFMVDALNLTPNFSVFQNLLYKWFDKLVENIKQSPRNPLEWAVGMAPIAF